jgi:hypothetical protein
MKWNIKFLSKNPPISEKHIVDFETILQCKLPASYRNFLLETNGGIPLNNAFDVFSPSENLTLYTFIVSKFLGINVKDDLIKAYQLFHHELPPFFFPFAMDNFKNFMCISCKTEEIYFWDNQSTLKKPKSIKEKPLFLFVAENFDEFMEKLYYQKN